MKRHGLDWLQRYVQTSLYNLLYTSTAKRLPQTDAGVTRLLSNVESSLWISRDEQTWWLLAYGTVAQSGRIGFRRHAVKDYYVTHSRYQNRRRLTEKPVKAPVIQVACKLARCGAFADVQINVVR